MERVQVTLVLMFLDVQISVDSKSKRRSASAELRSLLSEPEAVVVGVRYFVTQLPDVNSHKNHYIGPVSVLGHPCFNSIFIIIISGLTSVY